MPDIRRPYPNELEHYGVLGMKWGQHRAAKKGVSYDYTSMDTKNLYKSAAKYGRKASKLNNKADKLYERANMAKQGSSKQRKLISKGDKTNRRMEKMAGIASTTKQRAKYSKELDNKLSDSARNQSVGKGVAKALLLNSGKGYEIAKVSSGSRANAIAVAATTNVLSSITGLGPAAGMTVASLQRSAYIDRRMIENKR